MHYLKYFVLLPLTIILLNCDSNNEKMHFTAVLEGTVVKVPALTGGQIVRQYVDTGDEVYNNQILMVVDSTELLLQRRQLRAVLSELQVQTGIARANLERVSKDREYIQTKYNRIARLYQTNSVPQQNYDDIKNQLENISTSQLTARQQLQSLAAKREQIVAQIDLLDKKISDSIIRSPLNGLVATKYYEQGEAVGIMQPAVEIIDIRKVEAKIYISEQLLAQIKYNQEVQVRIDGLDQVLTGRISWISPKAEFTPKSILTPETRTSLVYAVKIIIDNPDQILKHGMPVVIEL